MKLFISLKHRESGGALLGYLVISLVAVAVVTTLGTLVVQHMGLSQRRQDMVNAYQFAQGGASIAALEVRQAFLNEYGINPSGGGGGGGSKPGKGEFFENLKNNPAGAYKKDGKLSDAKQLVYERALSNPYTNQTVAIQLVTTNTTLPSSVKVLSSATVGKVTQTVQVNLEMAFGYPAAIISTHEGDNNTGTGKGTAQGGNAVVSGSSGNTTRVDGGVLANGSGNTNQCQVDNVSQHNFGTMSQIPDYTNPGSADQLFDFNRFIAVADASGNHFANFTAFNAKAKTGAVLEGVIVVDVPKGEKSDLNPSAYPFGINIRGTLVVNFVGDWSPSSKIINTATMNINAADLSALNPNDPKTFKSGYPPKYTDPSKNPVNVNIKGKGFENFTAEDDLPALMYNNAILDIHGNVNISGVVYSPCFMEIENKQGGQIQYFKGTLIGGGGILFENNKDATSICSYDFEALNRLATAKNRGKTVLAVFRK